MKRMLTHAIVLTMLVVVSSVISCPVALAQKPAATDTAAATASNPSDTQAADSADDASLADFERRQQWYAG